MSIPKSEADVILNRTNVALARSQRLVASWLPPLKSTTNEEGLTNTKSEESQKDDEIFTPVPERLGLGAPLPQKGADGSWNQNELDSNDKLRKQLLGRNYGKVMKKTAAATAAANQTNKRQQDVSKAAARGGGGGGRDLATASSTQQAAGEGEGDDEEEGRTLVVGKKRKKAANDGPKQNDDNNDEKLDETGTHDAEHSVSGREIGEQPAKRGPSSSKGKKKAMSFLDEILAERSKKRKKK